MRQAATKKGLAPQYHFPKLRVKQRRKDFLVFCDRILRDKAPNGSFFAGPWAWTGKKEVVS